MEVKDHIEPPTRCVLLAPSRSGTTAMSHCMRGNPDIQGFPNVLKYEYLYEGREIDYGIYERMLATRARVAFCKITFGMKSAESCEYDPFPSDDIRRDLKIIMMMRDPVQTANSWKRAGFDPMLLMKSYRHTWSLVQRILDQGGDPYCMTYEHFTANPEQLLKNLCEILGISFIQDMVNWRHQFTSVVSERPIHGTLKNSDGIKKVENPIVLDSSQLEAAQALYEEYGQFKQLAGDSRLTQGIEI